LFFVFFFISIISSYHHIIIKIQFQFQFQFQFQLRIAAGEVGITRVTRERHFGVVEVTVEIGAVVKTGVTGVTQSEFVLTGFHPTLFGRQFEVVGAGSVEGVGSFRVRNSNRSRRSNSSSSPVVRSGRSSRSHRRKFASVSESEGRVSSR